MSLDDFLTLMEPLPPFVPQDFEREGQMAREGKEDSHLFYTKAGVPFVLRCYAEGIPFPSQGIDSGTMMIIFPKVSAFGFAWREYHEQDGDTREGDEPFIETGMRKYTPDGNFFHLDHSLDQQGIRSFTIGYWTRGMENFEEFTVERSPEGATATGELYQPWVNFSPVGAIVRRRHSPFPAASRISYDETLQNLLTLAKQETLSEKDAERLRSASYLVIE